MIAKKLVYESYNKNLKKSSSGLSVLLVLGKGERVRKVLTCMHIWWSFYGDQLAGSS